MKLERVEVSNFLRIQKLSLDLSAPVTIIAGPNEAGKSSLIDAIQFALTGVPARIRYSARFKKDLALLVHDGAQSGSVSVQGSGFATSTGVPNGKLSTTGTLPITGDRLEAVLTPGWFTALPVEARRAFLFDLLGIKLDRKTMIDRLEARGHARELVDMVSKVFGVKAWADVAEDCKEQASRHRGAWEQLTGEKYGDRKGETWVPPAPTKAPHTVAECTSHIERIHNERDLVGQELALAEDSVKRAARADDVRVHLLPNVDELQRQLDEDIANRAKVEATLSALESSIKSASNALTCPECRAKVRYSQLDNALYPVDEPPAESPEDLRKIVDDLTSSIIASQGLIDRHKHAEATIAAVGKPATAAQITKLREDWELLADDLRSWTNHRTAATEAEQYAAKVEAMREAVAIAHKRIVGFTALAEDVGPSGIPGQLVSEGLEEFNGRLTYTTGVAGWPRVKITEDMSVLVGNHGYALASESAKWRADAVIAEAISYWSTRMFVLDRVDVLDLRHRLGLVKLLATLAANRQIDTVIATGTFKAPPAGLPASIAVHWIEAGAITEGRKAA